MSFQWWWVLFFIIIVGSMLILLFLRRLLSPVKFWERPLRRGNIQIPIGTGFERNDAAYLKDGILTEWSEKELPDWKGSGKEVAPRILLAKLEKGVDLPLVNEYLSSNKPWSKVGSTIDWKDKVILQRDYDFTLVPLTTMLFQFNEDLDPDTLDHLLEKLLVAKGSYPHRFAPWPLRIVHESENHILMTEGSRYLRNKWLDENNAWNGNTRKHMERMEKWLLRYLKKMKRSGFYEFNSDPYVAYTATALLNLEAYGSPAIKKISRQLLNEIFFMYALGSLRFKRMAPFQRRIKSSKITSLHRDPLTPMMKIYCSYSISGLEIGSRPEHAVMASLMSYHPPDKVMEMVIKRNCEYYVKIGHGFGQSPEIYSASPKFLISAGGVNRGCFSRIVARPITLFIEDEAQELNDAIHMFGPGNNFKKWNNTGVYHKFAVSAGPVRVPEGWAPVCTSRVWDIYRRSGVTIGVHSRENLGIIVVMDPDPENAMGTLNQLNPDERELRSVFNSPEGESINYDILAPRNRWVIVSIGAQDVDRKFDRWPHLNGYINEIEN